jgi:very-short-patch-repair endonuclease
MSPTPVSHQPTPTDPSLEWLLGARIEREDPDLPVAALAWTPQAPRRDADLPDREVARVADAQWGFVHRVQAIAAGLGPGAIRLRLRRRWLTPYHRDVYLVGRAKPDPCGLALAAVLHFRGHAVAAGGTALWLWGLTDRRPGIPTVDLVARDGRSRDGIVVRRVRALASCEIRRTRSVPVVSPARAIAETAGGLDDLELENAVARCLDAGLATSAEIAAVLDRTPRIAGAGLLRRILAHGDPALTRSQAERLVRRLLRRAGLPQPVSNVKLHGCEVDFLWPQERLILEFDGWSTHRTRRSFERDRERDQLLVAAGFRVIRITWRQLQQEPLAVIARLAAALAQS